MSSGEICIVGPGTRFLSGVTYYTYGLAEALSRRSTISVILLRRLIPRFLYPGRGRVGRPISRLSLPESVPVYDGVDWYWGPSMIRAALFLARRKPSALVLQWWTGAALHTYIALASIARRLGAAVVIEFHEAQDTGEARIGLARRYVQTLMPALLRRADACVVHSRFDLEYIRASYPLAETAVRVVPHATYSHHERVAVERSRPAAVCNFLYFGVIRPFKGVEDLVAAFESIPPSEIDGFWLTVVGETWENWTLPGELIARSRYRERITFINRYVTDEEVDRLFSGADVVVLPYHRSSQSGPLHIAMHFGLPIVTTSVGGLVEAVESYEGACLAPPRDPRGLLAAMREAASRAGTRFASGRDWASVASAYRTLLEAVAGARAPDGVT